MKRGRILILLLAGIVIISFQNSTNLIKPLPPQEDATIYYYNEEGVHIGTDKGPVSKSYVIKTTKRQRDIYTADEIRGYDDFRTAKVLSISKAVADSVEWLISDGQTRSKFVERNVVEIVAKEVILAMRAAIKDDGIGGNFPNNNKEYGAEVLSGDVFGIIREGKHKDVCGTGKDWRVKLLSSTKSEFHSHPSGCRGNVPLYPCPRRYDEQNNSTCYYPQPPSSIDVEAVGEKIANRIGYVFGMRSRKIYIYDKRGVLAILDFNFLGPAVPPQ